MKKITPFKGALDLAAAASDEATATMEGVLKTMNLVLDGYDYEVELLAQALVSKTQGKAEVSERSGCRQIDWLGGHAHVTTTTTQ